MHGRCSVTEIQGKEFIDHFVCIRLSIIIQFHRRIEIELLPDSTQENTSHTILGIHLYLIGYGMHVESGKYVEILNQTSFGRETKVIP